MASASAVILQLGLVDGPRSRPPSDRRCRSARTCRRRAPSYRWCTSRPSRSFGSNQVDFGGMMPPASEIAIRSSIGDRGTSRSDGGLPESTASRAPSSLSRRRRNRCVCRCGCRRCRAPARGRRAAAARHRGCSRASRLPASRRRRASVYQRPATTSRHRPGGWASRAAGDTGTRWRNVLEELLRRTAAEILDGAVVREGSASDCPGTRRR